ncbi:MAG: tyrosine-type recombinase/integrase [Euryarchaeota archaeon]|nr:tyrosine-type recombinase/integrase [Euryarchaeota archaeon]MCG2736931.1 tyrosine-type recombinase/integrase [Candidatus Methanoperedenaceae archaeon]
MEIEKDEKLLQWFTNNELAANTRVSYMGFMQLFCDCVGLTPSQLVAESISEIKAGLLPAERKIGGQIAKFKKCMTDKRYAPKSFHIGIAAIRSFYKAFDIPLPSGVIKNKKAMPQRENNYFPKKEDITSLLTNAPNLREKAIILCMPTSGMGRQEIINLKVEDIQIDSDDIGTIGMMNGIRREKAQVDYVTFISPEAVHALKAYWAERDRLAASKENTTLEELKKQKFSHAEETLKRRQEIAKKLRVTPDAYAFMTYETGDKLSESHFAGIFHAMGEKLGYDDGIKGHYIKTRSHGLRKFFASTLENAGMPKNKIDFMLGHTPSGNDQAYFHHDITKLKELYKQYLPYITFEKKIEIRSLNTEDGKKLAELEKSLEKKDLEVLKANQEILGTKLRLETLERYIADLQQAISTKDKARGFYTGSPEINMNDDEGQERLIKELSKKNPTEAELLRPPKAKRNKS